MWNLSSSRFGTKFLLSTVIATAEAKHAESTYTFFKGLKKAAKWIFGILFCGMYIIFYFSTTKASEKSLEGNIVRVLFDGETILTGIYFKPPILIFVKFAFYDGP